ncbi:PDZ domain-containing protein [Singulisphaera rosea]
MSAPDPSAGRPPSRSALALVLVLVAAQGAFAQGGSSAIPREQMFEQYDMDPDGDLIVVPVSIGREAVPFILDTGTTLNAYDTKLSSFLGPIQEVIEVKTASGRETLKLYDPPKAFLGRLNLRTSDGVTCMDLAGVRRVTGHEFYGIIGMSFLLNRVVFLNFDEGKVAFLRTGAPRLGTPVPLEIIRQMPHVNVYFEGLGSRRLLCDSGSVGIGSGNLRSADFDGLLQSRGLTVLGSGLGADLSSQQLATRYGAVKRLTVGSETHEGLIFSDHVSSDILGMGFWKRYNVTFDFPNQVVYLQKNQFNAALDDPKSDRSGLQLKTKNGRLVVQGVGSGSAASMAGILPGDILVRVEGKDTANLRIRSVRRRLGEAGKDVSLSFRRGDQDFDVTLTLPGT